MINFQHNCHEGNCRVGKSSGRRIERRDVGGSIPIIIHDDSQSFILNSAAHYSAELHRRLSDVQLSRVSGPQWNEAIKKGVGTWKTAPVRAPQPRVTKARKNKRKHPNESPEHEE